ncbi:MAG TPA: hypothetical protein VHB27_04215 [Rhodopila sp.]|uniref:hypothetical protein n=1 Tax=Rhodopila sp. TaxID=2480087 RepID=UPI002CA8FAD3|nr:hypothetical protein [Rhodopila sp.]HVY14407.1 hypothetical protein [Rhodopila sp.]
MSSIDAVTVIADILRPAGDGSPGEVDRLTRWVADAIRPAIRLAADCPVEAITTDETRDLAPWIASLRGPHQADAHWASVHAVMAVSPTLDRLVLQRLKRRFVVGYELPPWLVRVLDERQIPYVDIRLHPVRFLDDLIFAVRAAVPQTQAALAPHAVPGTTPWVAAGLLTAMGRFISQARMPQGTLLIAGQRRFDSTQIAGGTFFDAGAQAVEVQALCARHAATVLKPHPHDPDHSLLAVAAAVPNALGTINDNIYRLMAQPQIEAVLTVNSGVAVEAPYFGKRVHTLLPQPTVLAWRNETARPGAHLGIDDFVLTPDFWRIVLAPHAKVTVPDGFRLPPKPNRLRIALDSFWNYQQVDTDRIPRSG